MRFCAACIALFLPQMVQAGDLEADRMSLRGLRSVGVIVENQSPEVQQNGLTVNVIQTDVESRLRQAGIPVLDSKESSKSGNAILMINVSIITSKDGTWPFMVNVELVQDSILRRDPSIVVSRAPTWSLMGFGSIGKTNVRSLRDDIKYLVDRFISAYLAMNAKR